MPIFESMLTRDGCQAKLAGVASMSEYKGVATNFRAQGITSLEVVSRT